MLLDSNKRRSIFSRDNPYEKVVDGLPPGVLADLLSKLLERANLPLTEAQRAELKQLATDWETHVDRQLADLGDDALALERVAAAKQCLSLPPGKREMSRCRFSWMQRTATSPPTPQTSP